MKVSFKYLNHSEKSLMSTPITKIIIVGGGTAGWMAAASLIRFADKKDLSITLIESSKIHTVGVGEATVPNIISFNQNLGINEIEFIKATQATFKLGIQFENWCDLESSFFHPFADYGVKIDNVEFHHYLNRLQSSGEKVQLSDYCFSSVLANKGNFAQPHPKPTSPLADFSYAYHFDADLYASYLKEFSIKLGVNHIDSKINNVSLNPESGFIQSVSLNNEKELTADLFIDCSGFKGLLIEDTLETGFEDWSHWLPCDSALAIQTKSTEPPMPYTRSIARDNGWQWKIPLQNRTGNGYIFSSHFESPENAQKTLLENIKGQKITQVKEFKFNTGRRKKIWNKNCFSLGLASGFLEPLESTSISLIQTAIGKLLSFFPDKSFNPVDIAEVNRLHNQELENIRDFLILHYKLTRRDDTKFWQHCQNLKIPESLEHKLDLFNSRGHITMYDNESFEKSSWLTIYNAFKQTPLRYDERADEVDINLIKNNLKKMRQSINKAATDAVSHQQFIDLHCKAK